MATRQPEASFRMGRIQAAVWKNTRDKQVFYNVTIQRSYRQGDNWKHSTTFGRNDLPLVAKVADQAHTWIYEQGSSDSESTTDVPMEGDGGGVGRFYHICEGCNAKFFCVNEQEICPRCGVVSVSADLRIPPWHEPDVGSDVEERMREAYLKQQSRLACPGCGEEPFLG